MKRPAGIVPAGHIRGDFRVFRAPCGATAVGNANRRSAGCARWLADEGEVVVAAGRVGDRRAAVGGNAEVGQVRDEAAIDPD